MADLDDFIERLPKAELHLHIEGTLEPELMFQLAERNGVQLPYASIDDARAAYDFGGLGDFLDLYYNGMRVLITDQDFHDLAMAYFRKAHADNVLHAEIFFDPQAHLDRGVTFKTMIDGLERARKEALSELGISSRLIMCFLRDKDPSEAMATLDQALAWREAIVGVGLDSAEAGHPPSKFKDVFERAHAEGFIRVAHAGEEGPPAYVAEAIDILHVARIDHGVRAIEDDALMARLARIGIPLTVCPLSNVRLRVFEDIAHHPIAEMIKRGLNVTINSDDPAYFGGYINDNFKAVRRAHGLDKATLATLARNSFAAAFLSDGERARLIGRLDAWLDDEG